MSSRNQGLNSPGRAYGYFMGGGAPPPAPKEDKRPDQVALLATNCLGCQTEEGGFHAEDCIFRQDTEGEYAEAPIRVLQVDIKKLIESYGLVPRYATLDRTGVLSLMGPSRRK